MMSHMHLLFWVTFSSVADLAQPLILWKSVCVQDYPEVLERFQCFERNNKHCPGPEKALERQYCCLFHWFSHWLRKKCSHLEFPVQITKIHAQYYFNEDFQFMFENICIKLRRINIVPKQLHRKPDLYSDP